MDGNGLLVVLATYNEISTLPSLIEQLFNLLPAASILVIDDNSPDGTGQWCQEYSQKAPRLALIQRQKKSGLGTAAILGFKYAIENGYSTIATMDADLSHEAKSLPDLIALLNPEMPSPNTPDVVIGSRYIKGGQIVGWPWYRQVSSFLVNVYARFLLRLPTRDNTSAFRVYDVDCLKQLEFSRFKSHGYSYLEEILVLLKRQNARFAEVPIVFREREAGKSKVDLKELASSLYQILKLSLVSNKT